MVQFFFWPTLYGGSTMTATDNDHDGHNHDGQLGEIYPTVLNELKCTFGVYIYR